MEGEIVELKNLNLIPCRDCMKCLDSRRCAKDEAFNRINEKIIACDVLFIVSPHYAPIPAKLCLFLEKNGGNYFLPMGKICHISIRSIRHKNGCDCARRRFGRRSCSSERNFPKGLYKSSQQPIANALHTIQLKLIPLSDEWNTGIFVRPMTAEQKLDEKIGQYVEKILNVVAT